MNIEPIIVEKLRHAFNPVHLDVLNESMNHNVPPNSETHFKVVLVTDHFSGKRQVQRHQQVYACLSEELQGEVHALALHTYSVEEWNESQGVPLSPQCLGGSKSD